MVNNEQTYRKNQVNQQCELLHKQAKEHSTVLCINHQILKSDTRQPAKMGGAYKSSIKSDVITCYALEFCHKSGTVLAHSCIPCLCRPTLNS